MLERLPPPARSVSMARAATSPTAIALTGAGVAIGWADHSIALAVLLGVGGWSARMAAALVRSVRRSRARRPRPEVIDPWAVPEPWRQFVRDALGAQTRFAGTLDRWPEGPFHDRLALVEVRVGEGAREVWQVAKQAASLSAAHTPAATERLSEQLRAVQSEQRRVRPQARLDVAGDTRPSPALELLDRSEAALAAQLHAARRLEAATQQATDRLRLLTARLSEAVTSLVEVSVGGVDEDVTARLAGSVNSVVDEIAALRGALVEAGTGPGAGDAWPSRAAPPPSGSGAGQPHPSPRP